MTLIEHFTFLKRFLFKTISPSRIELTIRKLLGKGYRASIGVIWINVARWWLSTAPAKSAVCGSHEICVCVCVHSISSSKATSFKNVPFGMDFDGWMGGKERRERKSSLNEQLCLITCQYLYLQSYKVRTYMLST